MGRTAIADIPGNFFTVRLGSYASVASGGANALLLDGFIAPDNLQILSAWRFINAAEVTVGTATSSASYRRMTLINAGAAGTGTTIMASLNATASGAATTTRAFVTTANNTIAAGGIILASHLTVGAAAIDGTDMAAGFVEIAYALL